MRVEALPKLIEEAGALAMMGARDSGVRLEFRLSPEAGLVLADTVQVQQVVLNILDNAIDAVGENGTITVSTGRAPDSRDIFVAVSDTGTGIPKDKLDKIFDPFFTTKKVGEGTGLGLTISYSIIEKLGGHIHVTSEEGQGTTFHITLPVGA